jgi:hypothetical protein
MDGTQTKEKLGIGANDADSGSNGDHKNNLKSSYFFLRIFYYNAVYLFSPSILPAHEHYSRKWNYSGIFLTS